MFGDEIVNFLIFLNFLRLVSCLLPTTYLNEPLPRRKIFNLKTFLIPKVSLFRI